MSNYSFRAHDRRGALALSQDLACKDDLDALAEGVRRSDSHAIEIFDGKRLVARVKQGNLPLDAMDRESL